MSELVFSSLISSSAGNCSVISGPSGVLLIDAGFSSQKKFRIALSYVRENFGPVRALLITHAHRDHVNYNTLRVLSSTNIPIYMSLDTIEKVAQNEKCMAPLSKCQLEFFEDSRFSISDLTIVSFPLEHSPNMLNHGFVVQGEGVKIGYATDLKNTRNLAKRFADCDLLFLESNHDLEMLRRNPNLNSHFHLPNCDASNFVAKLVAGGSGPRITMFGHLSTERNTPVIAYEEFAKRMQNKKNPPALQIAPAHKPSNIVSINRSNGLELFTPPTSNLFDAAPRSSIKP